MFWNATRQALCRTGQCHPASGPENTLHENRRLRGCSSPDRICNTWCITGKSFSKGRIKIILVNQDLGL